MRATLVYFALALSLVGQTSPEPELDPALVPISDDPALPRVLLIGDSISIGYTLPAREVLKGNANLHRIPTNGNSTRAGLKHLEQWLGAGNWTVIHFNWGLHDLKHWKNGKLDPAGPVVTPLDVYEENLRELVTQLKSTGAKLIWASTTPVPAGSVGRVPGDETKYNEVAARVMQEHGIAVNDLHAYCIPHLDAWQLPSNVHFNAEGSKALAEKVAQEITAALQR
jgi:hypothetical protein